MPKGMNARFREMFKPRNECTPERNAAVNTTRKTQTTNQGLHYIYGTVQRANSENNSIAAINVAVGQPDRLP